MDGVDFTDPAQDRGKYQTLTNAEINLPNPQIA